MRQRNELSRKKSNKIVPNEPNPLEMLLCKRKVDRLSINRQTLLLDRLGQSRRSAKERPDLGAQRSLPTGEILPRLDRHPQPAVDRLPVWPAKDRARAEERERVVRLPGVVDCDVPEHVFVDLLREEDVHAQKVWVGLGSLDFLEQGLEPAKRGGVSADPEELDTLQRAQVPTALAVPDVLQDARKRRNTDPSADQNRNLRIEHVLCRRTVRPVDANAGKSHPSDRVDLDKLAAALGDGVESFTLGARRPLLERVHSGLGERGNDVWSCADALTEGVGEITDLADVQAHVRVFGRRGDGERVPLERRDVGDLDKEPLAGGVLEAGFLDAQLHRARRVDEDLLERGGTAGANLAPETLSKVEDGRPDDEAP
jgi:hypothetical protein